MTEIHPFVVRVYYETRVDHIFLGTREQAVNVLKSIHESYESGIVAITDDCVISLLEFQKAVIMEKPADVSDAKWLG